MDYAALDNGHFMIEMPAVVIVLSYSITPLGILFLQLWDVNG